MALRIVDVKLTTNYDWQNIRNMANWHTVRNSNSDWQQFLQTTTVSEAITIEVEVIENNWLSLKENYLTWQRIKDKFAYWLDIKNY